MAMTLLAQAAATQPNNSAAFLTLIIFIIVVALVFDFLNGFHDAANSIATIVGMRVLTPTVAVAWAAFFNFVAAFVFGTAVSKAISDGIVNTESVDIYVVSAGLVGAIVWNIITWLLGLPTSSSHALVAGIAGAAVTKAGFGVLILPGKWRGIILFIFLGPIISLIVGMIFMTATAWIFRRSHPGRVDGLFRRLQFCSAAIFSLSHGGNDAQKTMGIIVMLLSVAGYQSWTEAGKDTWFQYINVHHYIKKANDPDPAKAAGQLKVPNTAEASAKPKPKKESKEVAPWIILICHFAIGLGTLFGGWRIVKTMGTGITRLQPVGGFCAESAAASVIIAATNLGIPISTTHAITGSILGVGTTKGIRAVRWIWGQRIVMAWLLTIPCTAFMAALTYGIIHITVEKLMR